MGEVFVHGCSGTATIAHSEDDGGTTSYDVSSGKDGRDVCLHTVVDYDGVLATEPLMLVGTMGLGETPTATMA